MDKQDSRGPGNHIKWGEVEGTGAEGSGNNNFLQLFKAFCWKKVWCDFTLEGRSNTSAYRLQEDRFWLNEKNQIIFRTASQWPRWLQEAVNLHLETFRDWITLVRHILKKISLMRIGINVSEILSTSNIPWFYESWDQVRKEVVTFWNINID